MVAILMVWKRPLRFAPQTGWAISSPTERRSISSPRALRFAATTLNIDGGDLDGVETTITVRASDRMGNIVADGTTINFIAEGAQIRGENPEYRWWRS